MSWDKTNFVAADPEMWQRMNEEFGPGHFFPKTPSPPVDNPHRKTVFENPSSLPGSVKILDKSDPLAHKKITQEGVSAHIASGNYAPGIALLVPYKVEGQRCWAIVDTGASKSLISRGLAAELGNAITPHQNRLLGPVGNVIPTQGTMKAEVQVGDVIAEDEFVVVDNLYPEVRMGLKFMLDHKCTVDTITLKFGIQTSEKATVFVPMQLGDRHIPPPERSAHVFETVPGPGLISATPERNEKLEQKVDEMVNLATSGLEDRKDLEKYPTVLPRVASSRHTHLYSCFASLAPEEMLASGQVGRHTSRTKSADDLAQRQQWDPGIRGLFKVGKRPEMPRDEYMSFPR